MEDAGSQPGVGLADGEDVAEVLHRARPARSDDRNAQLGAQPGEGLVGKSLLDAVVVHAGEQNLARAALLGLVRPLKEAFFGRDAAAVDRHYPLAVIVEAGVDGGHHKLAAEVERHVVDQLRVAHGRRVDAYLVGTGIEQHIGIGQLADAAAHGERDVDVAGYAGHQVREGFALLVACRDVEKHQFVGALGGIPCSQFHGVAHLLYVEKFDSFDSHAVFDVEAWNDAFC